MLKRLKLFFRILHVPSLQVVAFINFSKKCRKIPLFGKILSTVFDNLILYIFSLETTSSSLEINNLIIGHSTGVVLGGNGIRSNGDLHISSGGVFARRYNQSKTIDNNKDYFFDIDGDLTVGANSVLLGPLSIKGPTIIGALSVVTKDIIDPGVYVGSPAKKIRDL